MRIRITGLAVLAPGVLLVGVAAASAASTTLYSFTGGADGGSATTAPVDGGDGLLYGVTPIGGVVGAATPDGAGTIYSLDAFGHVKMLHTFDRMNGERPTGLTRAADGWFYGTTSHGGDRDPASYNGGQGRPFRWNPAAGLEVLHRFWPIHGSWPSAAPILGPDARGRAPRVTTAPTRTTGRSGGGRPRAGSRSSRTSAVSTATRRSAR